MAADTTTAWNFNRYNYAANNPYKFKDPDGRCIGFLPGYSQCELNQNLQDPKLAAADKARNEMGKTLLKGYAAAAAIGGTGGLAAETGAAAAATNLIDAGVTNAGIALQGAVNAASAAIIKTAAQVTNSVLTSPLLISAGANADKIGDALDGGLPLDPPGPPPMTPAGVISNIVSGIIGEVNDSAPAPPVTVLPSGGVAGPSGTASSLRFDP